MKTILIIVGTRPEAIKLIPVYKELKRVKRWKTVLISTGQHKQMLQSVFDFFEVAPDRDMHVMTKNQTLEQLTGALLLQCSSLYEEYHPDLVVVQGDTTTAMAAAMSAYYKKIKIAHVEAGLRSFDRHAPFPEELNRRVISLMADFHFAPTALAASLIRQEKVEGKIFKVGNTVIDSLIFACAKVKKRLSFFKQHYARQLNGFDQMILITGHRRESFGEGFKHICEAIRDLAQHYPKISFVYPVHLNPNVRDVVFKMLSNKPNVFLCDPVPYDHMVFLMMRSYLVLTDSGGVQEEAPTLGKPVLVMRSKTERPEGVKAGCNVLVGTSRKKIVKEARALIDDLKLYKKRKTIISPYGIGNSAKEIQKILTKFI